MIYSIGLYNMVATSLCTRGYALLKSAFDESVLDSVKHDLTVEPYVPGAPASSNDRTKYKLFLESSQKLYIPKCYGYQKFGKPDEVKLGNGDDRNMPFVGDMRPEQMDVVDAFVDSVSRHDSTGGGGIINLGCGGGKTVIGLQIASLIGKKTMIIAHKDFLIEQWRERIMQFIPSAKIGIIKAKIIDVHDKDIVLASLQSLSMKAYPASVFDGIGLLIIDEVHRSATEVFSQALIKNTFYCTLGLSATIQRKDGMQKIFQWYLGDVVYKKKKKKDNVKIDNIEFWDSDPNYFREETMVNGKLNISRMVNNICAHVPRTKAIVERIVNYLDESIAQGKKRRKVLVLSDRKAHLSSISGLLPSHLSSGFYIGGMKPDDLHKSERKDVILATYAFASEGFDVKDLDTLVLASPKSDIEQSVGRVLRAKAEDRMNIPIVIDIIDQISFFEMQAAKRKVFYRKHGFTLVSNSPDVDSDTLDARATIDSGTAAFLED